MAVGSSSDSLTGMGTRSTSLASSSFSSSLQGGGVHQWGGDGHALHRLGFSSLQEGRGQRGAGVGVHQCGESRWGGGRLGGTDGGNAVRCERIGRLVMLRGISILAGCAHVAR